MALMLEPVTSNRSPGGRTRTLFLVVGLAILVVFVAGATMAWSSMRTRTGPAEVVTAYVNLLAAGDAAAASALVDPTFYSGYSGRSEAARTPTASPGSVVAGDDDIALDPDLLIAAASTSDEHIVVTEVTTDEERAAEAEVGDLVDVEVGYELDGLENSALLRAERLDDTAVGFTQWRVVDPLLVPLVVQSRHPELGPATIGESSAAVDVSGPGFDGATQRATLLYPGIYSIQGPDTPYFEGGSASVVLAGANVGPVGELPDTVTAQLSFTPTLELQSRVERELEGYLAGCLDPATADGLACPDDFYTSVTTASSVELTTVPRFREFAYLSVPHPGGVAEEPMLRSMFTTGIVEFTNPAGEREGDAFDITALVAAEGDDVSIEFGPYPF